MENGLLALYVAFAGFSKGLYFDIAAKELGSKILQLVLERIKKVGRVGGEWVGRCLHEAALGGQLPRQRVHF